MYGRLVRFIRIWKRLRELEHDMEYLAAEVCVNATDIGMLSKKFVMFKDISKRIESNNQKIHLLKKQMGEMQKRVR